MLASGQPLLAILVERLSRANGVDEIVVATTSNDADQPIAELAAAAGIRVFRGSEADVLGRVSGALRASAADICVEITGDCPLVDPSIVSEALSAFLETRGTNRYVSNSDPHRAVPAGLDVQVFEAEALHELDQSTNDPLDREHVSYGFYRPEARDRWRPRFITHDATRGAEDLLVTLDYLEDYEMIKRLHEDLSRRDSAYGATQIVGWLRAHPEEQARCRAVRGTA
jgi:spore coat polysaccharide biosynthesis protein SpsF